MSSTTFVLLIVLVVTPLLQNIQLVSQGKPMGVNGAYEIRFLAQTYNDVLAMSGAQKDLLRYQAEHDPLTGIMNRGAFDKLRQIMGPDTTPMTMLMVDIDKFKEINDCYGHETGDRVLQRVAQLLQDGFHARDFTMRLGGDEFSIFLPGSTIAQRAWIEAQVCQINSQLRNPTDDLPPVSISVGVAFSSAGFTDDLYTHTDQALYQVKESGRCGCGFYEECA
jgi:diguanylate cyclase (GGDEF)-like protein